MSFPSLKNHFLIAMPGLADLNFYKAVAFICEHHKNGAMGIVVNHPLELTMKELYDGLEMNACGIGGQKSHLYYGGPVQKERGFVLHSCDKAWESTVPISSDISLTGSKEILEDIAQDRGPKDFIVALGYAGWGAGQLEDEISANSWLTVPADPQLLFEIDYRKRWSSAARRLGVDVNLMSNQAGHA